MKNSKIPIKIGQQTMLMLLLVFALFSSNNITAQDDELVIIENSKKTYKELKIRERDGFTDMKIEYKGDIRVSNNDKSITSISSGGYLKIYKKHLATNVG